ncbi:recombination-associated protein RdgC [Candidatus Thiosymbion oneisti]|uniref:recombination-associated protein RdgC n=1 Tax=Candidatus Thiosymbion oneisti TaxID=589554 RepID=UPI00105DAF82|nr:recombination-associated protein RdgC [Candidatus Thiosymbion oneisti]
MFKNVRLYRLEEPSAIDADGLEQQLSARRFHPCGPLQTASLGWHPPLGEQTQALSHAGNGCIALCARRQERLLPSTVVSEALDERVVDLEEREARTVGRRERRQLREEVLLDMLPRAFTRSRQIHAYLDLVAGWMVVDAASEKGAEELVGLLRDTLGSFRVRPPRPGNPPPVIMTRWVATGEMPEGLALGDVCELRDARDERALARCSGQDLGAEEIATHLRAGKEVVKLALQWREQLEFLLQEDLSLRRLRFAEALLDEAREPDIEDEAARFDAEFAIMALQLRELIQYLDELFEPAGGT